MSSAEALPISTPNTGDNTQIISLQHNVKNSDTPEGSTIIGHSDIHLQASQMDIEMIQQTKEPESVLHSQSNGGNTSEQVPLALQQSLVDSDKQADTTQNYLSQETDISTSQLEQLSQQEINPNVNSCSFSTQPSVSASENPTSAITSSEQDMLGSSMKNAALVQNDTISTPDLKTPSGNISSDSSALPSAQNNSTEFPSQSVPNIDTSNVMVGMVSSSNAIDLKDGTAIVQVASQSTEAVSGTSENNQIIQGHEVNAANEAEANAPVDMDLDTDISTDQIEQPKVVETTENVTDDLMDIPPDSSALSVKDNKPLAPIKISLTAKSQEQVETSIELKKSVIAAESPEPAVSDDEAPPGTEGVIIRKTTEDKKTSEAEAQPIKSLASARVNKFEVAAGNQSQNSSVSSGTNETNYSEQNWNNWNWQHGSQGPRGPQWRPPGQWGPGPHQWRPPGPGPMGYWPRYPPGQAMNTQAQQYAQQYSQWQQNYTPGNQQNQYAGYQQYQQGYYGQGNWQQYNQQYNQQSNWYGAWQQNQTQQQGYPNTSYQVNQTAVSQSYPTVTSSFPTSTSVGSNSNLTNIILSKDTSSEKPQELKKKSLDDIPLPPPTPAEPAPEEVKPPPPPLPASSPPREPKRPKPMITALTKDEIAAKLLEKARKKNSNVEPNEAPESKRAKQSEGEEVVLPADPASQRHLCITNLPAGTKAVDLRDYLSNFGRVSMCKIAAGKGKNAGIFAFVTIETLTDPSILVSSLNGQNYNGSKLSVKKLKNPPGAKPS